MNWSTFLYLIRSGLIGEIQKRPPPPVYIRVVITGLWAFSSDRSVCRAWTQGGSWLSVTFVLLHVVFRNSEVVREGWGVSKHMFYPLTPNPRLPRSVAAVSQKSVWFHSSKFCCFQMGVGGVSYETWKMKTCFSVTIIFVPEAQILDQKNRTEPFISHKNKVLLF